MLLLNLILFTLLADDWRPGRFMQEGNGVFSVEWFFSTNAGLNCGLHLMSWFYETNLALLYYSDVSLILHDLLNLTLTSYFTYTSRSLSVCVFFCVLLCPPLPCSVKIKLLWNGFFQWRNISAQKKADYEARAQMQPTQTESEVSSTSCGLCSNYHIVKYVYLLAQLEHFYSVLQETVT